MVYRVQFHNVGVRAVFLLGLLGFAATLAWLSSRYFIIRTLADERLSYSRDVLTPAIERFPHSAKLQKRMVESYLIGDPPDYAKATEHAMHAVQLSPHTGRLWYWLAQAQEAQGLVSEAEQSLWQAAELAPADSQINWGLANLLVRVGKVDESVEYFRRAVTLNASLYPQAFDTLWQAGGRKLEPLRMICLAQPFAQVSLAQYLVEQKLFDECAMLFQSLTHSSWDKKDLAKVAASPQTYELLNSLVSENQVLIARQIWLQLQETSNSDSLWDGGFEYVEPLPLPQFAWALQDSEFARVGYDRKVKHSGSYALKLLFTGKDSTQLTGEVRQRLALQPGRRYRFEAMVKSEGLVTSEGPRLAVIQNGQPVAQSVPLPPGTWDWQLVSFDFVAPAASENMIFDIVRRLKLAYDEPMKGSLWFDDLKLFIVEN